MDLKHLKSFLHVAELGSLSRAAERLNVTQPALSRQIRLLEQDLGTALFHRTGRGVRLSEAGAVLESRAGPLISELEAISGDIAAQAAEVSGSVVLGIPPSVSAVQAGDLVEHYRARHPRVSLRIVVALSGAVREGLLRGKLDLGILYKPAISANLATEDLWTERLLLVGPEDSGLGPERPVPFAEALGHPLILPGPRHGLRATAEAYALRAGLVLDTAVEAESLRVILDLVRRGLGFTFLPLRAVVPELKAGLVRAAPLVDPTPERTAALAWARDRRLDRGSSVMADLIRRESRSWQGESRSMA